jgi:hypothetical protein
MNMYAYTDMRRRNVRAIEAFERAKLSRASCGWKAFYPHGVGGCNMTRQRDRPSYAWIEKPRDAGLRLVGYADEIVNLRHKGWYCDEHQDDLFRGVVYRLPHSRGFIAGYADPWNDGPAFVCLELAEDGRQAAFWADSIAEREAESEREYQERENEKIRTEEENAQFAKDREAKRPDMYA